MKYVFADTSFYLGLVLPHDRVHRQARQFMRSYREAVVTSEHVMLEIANQLSRIRFKHLFSKLYKGLKYHSFTSIQPIDHTLWIKSIDLYEQRLDKDWSLTDCSSMLLMEKFQISEVLTTDHHFTQAGMIRLLD